jgi:hypothetical protein
VIQYEQDPFGVLGYPNFSPGLIEELRKLKRRIPDEDEYKKAYRLYLEGVNKTLVDQYNAFYAQKCQFYRDSVSHKAIKFIRMPKSHSVDFSDNEIRVVKDRSCYNTQLAILDITFHREVSSFQLTTTFTPKFTVCNDGVIMNPSGIIKNVIPVDKVYLIYALNVQRRLG